VQVARPLVHDAIVERLWRAARAGRLPHALLFEGQSGIGKYQAAKWFAQGCLCAAGPGIPCGACGPCRRVASGGEHGNHADLFVIDPIAEEEERIRIARIAERGAAAEGEPGELCLEVFLGLRPLEGERRVVLVRECQRMNVPAQNALLKTLEEPRPGTLMVLETARPSALLATIKSRCIRIRFGPLPSVACVQVLVAAGIAPSEAPELARWAGGSPGLALAMARNATRGLLERLTGVALGERGPLEVSAELEELEGEFAGKTDGARERERCRAVLELARALLCDASRAAAGADPAHLSHGEVARVLAARRGPRALAQATLGVAELRADVDHNLAPRALLERALLTLAEGVPASRR
jgi:DNA polymerase-3 subunit delta'